MSQTLLFVMWMLLSMHGRTILAQPVNLRPDLKEFVATIKGNYHRSSTFNVSRYRETIGSDEYVAISDLHPGQNRYSYGHIITSLGYDLRKYTKNDGKNDYELIFNEKRSVFPITDARKGVLTDFGIVLVDGHHSVFTSLYLGADTMPIRITEDLSGVSAEKVWDTLEGRMQVYLKDLSGGRKIPGPSFLDLEDDPNRFLTALGAFKVDGDGTNFVATPSKNDFPPLWIKVNESIPFIEFILADILYKKSIAVDNETLFTNSLSNELLRDIRASLLEEYRSRQDGLGEYVDIVSDDTDNLSLVKFIGRLSSQPGASRKSFNLQSLTGSRFNH